MNTKTELKWSSEKPTQDGYYWYAFQEANDEWELDFTRVVNGDVMELGDDFVRRTEDIKVGLWCPAIVSPAPDLPTEWRMLKRLISAFFSDPAYLFLVMVVIILAVSEAFM